MGTINQDWLPEGHHYDLHIEHGEATGDAGPFTGGGWKFLVHITVSPWGALDAMVDVLRQKHAEPHLVIGGRKGRKHPVVVQLLPFDVAGRAMRNDVGDMHQTNRARCIQVEICANPGRSARRLLAGVDERDAWLEENGSDLFSLDGLYLTQLAMANEKLTHPATDPTRSLCMREPPQGAHSLMAMREAFEDGVASWSDDTYKALGNLLELVNHRRPEIPLKCPRSFQNTKRFTDAGFERTAGVVGHMHAPDNDHIDPTTAFRGDKLVQFAKSAPNDL